MADTVLQILERARIGNWTIGQLAEECIKEGMERAAEICDNLVSGGANCHGTDCAQAIRSAKEKL